MSGKRTVAQLESLVSALPEAERTLFRRIFHVTTDTAEVVVPDTMAAFVQSRFGSLEAVSQQTVVKVTNLVTLDGAIYNPLRAIRPRDAPDSPLPDEIVEGGPEDPFCAPLEQTTENTFGRVRGAHSVTAANLVPFEGFHAVVIFDNHNPLAFTEETLGDALDTALAWARLAHSQDAEARYFFLFWNCLWRAGGSRVHGHMQATLGRDMHHAQVEALRRAALRYRLEHGANYFEDLCAVHDALGLTARVEDARILACLTPRKEKEVWVVSQDIDRPFRRALYEALRVYVRELGVKSFNMALLLRPMDSAPEDWSGFPAIGRIVDRGQLNSRVSDIGAMELFGTSVVSSDPFLVAEALRRYVK